MAVFPEAAQTFWNDECCIIIRPLSAQWQSTRLLFGVEVSQQNSETN